ncbi:MAG TPA: PEP-CTERM sorting domain-containing protein [Candidatus Accumulibacter phosphatis]|nr:PEP-CTERM sorting domain-containing protein [Candidatus Accumulibacter phosphatis]HRQ97594.1 PEP-CTERM sorting domain-containing protein [Candidatus Accumulibacter phosphatis]
MKLLHSHLHKTLIGVALATFLAGAPQAAELFSQSRVNGGTALDGAYSIGQAFGFQNAERYSLSAASTWTGLRWWGTDADENLFVVRMFADPSTDLTAPEIRTVSGSVVKTAEAGVSDNASNAIFRYEMTLSSPEALGPGSGYVSLFLDSDSDLWYWLEGSGGDGVSLFRGVEGDSWHQGAPDLSLELIGRQQPGQIPEPAVPALLLLAAAALARRRCRCGGR